MNVIENLHAKMYLVEAGISSFAVTTSMNLTQGSTQNLEAAIFSSDSKIFRDHYNAFLKNIKPKSTKI